MNWNLNYNVWLILIILIDIINNYTATGFKCYECSTSWNDDCRMSPPPSKYLKICPAPICSKYYSEENGVVRVERYCGDSDYTPGCREAAFPDRLPGARYFPAVTCRCGDQEACNNGFATMSMGIASTLAISILSVLFP